MPPARSPHCECGKAIAWREIRVSNYYRARQEIIGHPGRHRFPMKDTIELRDEADSFTPMSVGYSLAVRGQVLAAAEAIDRRAGSDKSYAQCKCILRPENSFNKIDSAFDNGCWPLRRSCQQEGFRPGRCHQLSGGVSCSEKHQQKTGPANYPVIVHLSLELPNFFKAPEEGHPTDVPNRF